MYQNYSRLLAVLALGLILTTSAPAVVAAASVSQINLDPSTGPSSVKFTLSENDAVESVQSSSASRSTSILNGYIQATDISSSRATVTIVRNINTGLEDPKFCAILPSHAGKSVAPLDDFLLSYTLPSNLYGYPLHSLPKTVNGKKNLLIPMSPYSNPTGYTIDIPRDSRDYDTAGDRNTLSVCQPAYHPGAFSANSSSKAASGTGTNGSYVSATFRVGDKVVLAPNGYRTWAVLTLTDIRNGKADFTISTKVSDDEVYDSTASFSSLDGVGSTDSNPVMATQAGFSTSQFVRVSSDVPDVAFERGLIVEISNAERGTYLEATSIVSPVSGNSASGSVTIREVTWTKDWSDRCSNERFNSKDCTFSFDDSTNRARLEVPSQERTYVVKVGQTISIPARNVMTPAANNNKGEDGYYVLTLRGVNYAQNPVATFRASPQRNPGSNPASSGGTSVSVSVASTGSGIAANPAFSVPVRTPGMSQTEYLYSVQATYLKALGQLQSLAGQLSQSADTVNRETGAETQTTGSGSGASAPQATAAQGELAQLSLRLSALQSQLMGGAASAASTGSFAVAAQPAQASTVPAANQECGPSTYENVDGEWKYVGCAGYYGQGAGNKQVNVAAGYKGADPSNAVQGSLGYYDEDGVYHSDAAFDRARDADPEVDVRAGQLGVDYCPLSNGFKTICSISYYDPEGVKLTQGTFDPASILTVMDRFGIDREQLEDLEKGMEKKNIPHLPGEMFPGTGSDAGINLTDLANGGLGTAYDWRVDPFCQIKGPTACAQVKANAALADALDIEPNRKVTDTDSTSLEAQLANLKREATALQNKI